MKKNYVEPAMRAVKLQQRRMLCDSGGAKSLNNSEGFNWANDGVSGEDY